MSTFEMEKSLPADERIIIINSLKEDYFNTGSGKDLIESSNFKRIENMVLNYYKMGKFELEVSYLKANGEFDEHIVDGIKRFSQREVIISRFAEFKNHIIFNNRNGSEVSITDDLPKFTWHMRNMFLPEYDKLIFASCHTGISEGWNDLLGLISRPKIPLLRIPKRFEEIRAIMLETSRKYFPDTKDIVLPTKIPGANAKYYYSDDFEMPYITLEINDPVSGNSQVTE